MKVSEKDAKRILKELSFENELVTAIARDYKSEEILMVAFMNEEAVVKTLTTGIMHYWSRSREKIWKKGEVSGNRQKIREIRVDCDGDALLFDVDPEGPACHKGYRSCFYRKIEDSKLVKIDEKEFEPSEVYG